MIGNIAPLASIEDDLNLIVTAAEAAGQIALPYFRGESQLNVQLKTGNSPVSAADLAVNDYLHTTLTAARPHYGWLSEETADENQTRRIDAPRTFVVDPIDGTRGFIEGNDMWCISIAIVEGGAAIAGVLLCPARSEIYTASLGGGVKYNGKEHVLSDRLPKTKTIGGPRMFLDTLDRTSDEVFVRHPHVPSLACRIAMVATGKMQATFIKPHAHDWDIAAAGLILAEAGGVLVDGEGKNLALNQESVKKPVMLASHNAVTEQMLAIVQQASLS